MTITPVRPAPEETARQASAIFDAWMADPEMGIVLKGCSMYTGEWDDFYGGPLVSNYNAEADAPNMLDGALKVMAIKSAVLAATGNELTAELPTPVPLDVTTHALTAQFGALTRIQQRTGHTFVHSTVNERLVDTPYRTGDYTQQVYELAFGPVDERYWIDGNEVERRRVILDAKYSPIGITERGTASAIDFASA